MADYELHKRLGYRVSLLSRIMQSRLETLLAEHDLTRLSWCVLSGVGEEGVTSPSELATYVGVTRPAMSRLLRELESRRLIERRNGHNPDGRAVRIGLTEKGKKIMSASRLHANAVNDHFTSKLPPEHLRTVLDGLAALTVGEDKNLTSL